MELNELFIPIIVACIIFIAQFYFFQKSKKACKELEMLFPPKEFNNKKTYLIKNSEIDIDTKRLVHESEIEDYENVNVKNINLLAIDIDCPDISQQFKTILSSTNSYLKNNLETIAEFNILKDIAERVSESEENKIGASISLPLYIGLMGTFIGVILGIFNIVFHGFSEQNIGESLITDEAINQFLGGVLVAMVGSLFGLIFTTYSNSWHFKKAKAARDENKNAYFNFLQTSLLPTLDNTLSKNLMDFRQNLAEFNSEFSVNIGDFKGTIPAITDNMKLQADFIKDFRNINIPELAKANIEIFDKLEQSSKVFENFNKYSKTLNKNFETADQYFTKMNELLNRFSNFENNINQIGVLVKESEDNYLKIGEYIVEKLGALKERYQVIQEFINKSDEKVIEVSNSYLDKFNETSQKLQIEFEKSFDFARNDNPFSKLNLLKDVNDNLKLIGTKLENNKQNQSNKGSDSEKLADAILQLTNSMNSLKHAMRPSIFRPKELFYYIFSKNGYHNN